MGARLSAQVLAQTPLFAGLPPDDLVALAALLRSRRYGKGEVIFHQEDPGATLYLIGAGHVTISLPSPEGREFVLALLGPGDFFGELALLDGEPHSADAVAAEGCQILLLKRQDFVRFLQARPQAALSLLAALSRRLRRTDQLVQDVAFLDVPTRLARALLQLAESQGQPTAEGVVLASRLTQGDLANMIGTTRESLNKWLRYYARKGLLRHQQGQVTLLKLPELRTRADFVGL